MRVLLGFIFGIFMMLSPVEANEDSFSDFRWKYRLFVVFSPSMVNPDFTKQLTGINKNLAGFKERDLLRVYVSGKDDFMSVEYHPVLEERREQIPTNSEIYKSYGTGKDKFEVILIGKDGGVKARWDGPADIDGVFALIDSMPMRQKEMKNP